VIKMEKQEQRIFIGKDRFYVLQEICNLGVKEFENELSHYRDADNFTEVVRVQTKIYELGNLVKRLEDLRVGMKWL